MAYEGRGVVWHYYQAVITRPRSGLSKLNVRMYSAIYLRSAYKNGIYLHVSEYFFHIKTGICVSLFFYETLR